MAIEEPEFKIESKFDDFEIRRYGPTLVAETTIESEFDQAGNLAFKILANYIFGNNKSRAKIEMTAPVTQQPKSQKIPMTAPVNQLKTEGGFLVQFTMPKNYTLENIPEPNDPRVRLRQMPARRLAVYSYSGGWSESRYNKKLSKFRSALQTRNFDWIAEPIFARFNSPFQLWFLRRNEIWIELASK